MAIKTKQLEKLSPYFEYEITDHFMGTTVVGGALNFGTVLSGGLASIFTGNAATPGVARLSTGTGTTGSANLRSLQTALTPPGVTGLQNYRCRFRYRIPIGIISTTDAYSIVCGFGNGNGAGEPTIGAYLYFDSVDGIQYFICKSATGRTAIANILQPVNVWLDCFITLLKNGTVKFEIQNSEGGSTFTTTIISTDVPTEATQIGMQYGILKSSGTANRYLDLDYINFGINSQAV